MKRRLPKECHQPRFGAHFVRSPLEVYQPDTTTSVPTSTSFPFEDLRPGALVHGVMYGHDGLHVGGLRIVVLASHGSEELGL